MTKRKFKLIYLLIIMISFLLIGCEKDESKDYSMDSKFAITKTTLVFKYFPESVQEGKLLFFRTKDEYRTWINQQIQLIQNDETKEEETIYLSTIIDSYDDEYFKENMIFLYFEKQTKDIRNVTVNAIFLKGNSLYFDVKKVKADKANENVSFLVETKQLAFAYFNLV